MKKKSSQSTNGKKGLSKLVITAIAIVIVVIASLMGFGGSDAEEQVSNSSESIVSENISEDVGEESISEINESEKESVVEDISVEEVTEEDSTEEAESEELVSEEEYAEEVSEELSEEEISEDTYIQEITVAEIKFRNDRLLDQHYEKHGIEMGFASAEEYELAAYKVVINPDALHKIESEDGDDVYYVEESNEFVVVSQDGYIRTYFNPSAGIDYYNRQ